MMFAKDTSNNAEHMQYSRVKATRDTAVDSAPAGYTRPAGTFDVVNTVPDFNLGFATRIAALQGQSRQFSCAIPLHHIFGFAINVRKVIYGAKHTIALVRKGNDNDAI